MLMTHLVAKALVTSGEPLTDVTHAEMIDWKALIIMYSHDQSAVVMIAGFL